MERSEAIRKIERDMIELSRMYQEVAELVQQQEAPVEQISEDAEQAKTHIQDANVNLSKAVKSAINARKWKWYALIICRKYFSVSLMICGTFELTSEIKQFSSLVSSWVLLSVSRKAANDFDLVQLLVCYYCIRGRLLLLMM